MRVLVTGGAGLVGSECCKLFYDLGYEVSVVDNDMRGKIFGKEGSVKSTIKELQKDYDIEFYQKDIEDDAVFYIASKADIVIHTAAQPSHPRSIEIPQEDFNLNARATLTLLENLRKSNPECIFIFCSTNKVYGDAPNYYSYKITDKRFEPEDPAIWDGFNESLRIDNVLHTPFGVSKVAADLYCQEYAKLYGITTGIFRMGCITGSGSKAVEMHNWEPYFIKKALAGEKINIFGYNGMQVRDVIDAYDLARLFYLFAKDPKAGEVYNIGGGRKNSISLLEAMDLIEEITGCKMHYTITDHREGDHKWYISDMKKIKSHYNWGIRRDLKTIFKDIYEALKE